MPETFEFNFEQLGIIDPIALVNRYREFIDRIFVVDHKDLKPFKKHIRKPIVSQDDINYMLCEIGTFANLRNLLFKKSPLLELRQDEIRTNDNTDLTTLNDIVAEIIKRSSRPIPPEFRQRIIDYHNLLAETLCKLIAGMQDPSFLLTEKGLLKEGPVKVLEELLFLIGDDDFLDKKIKGLEVVEVTTPFVEWRRLGELYNEYKAERPFPGRYGIIRRDFIFCLNILNDALRSMQIVSGIKDLI